MTVAHEAVAALPVGTDAVKQLIRDAMVRRMPYALSSSDNPQQLVAVDPASGADILDILYLGRVFHYDSTDTTTAHDGTTCLVTSEGRRYKLASGTDVFAYSVINNTRTTPPSSPTIGDAYLIASSPTGAWAGHAGAIGVFTARGWEFVAFDVGRFIYVEALDSYYHKDSGGNWVAGFGSQALSSASVLPSNMLGGVERVRFSVENMTQNSVPTQVDGRSYIIGSSPGGAWAGQSEKIAHGENGQWVIYTPREGTRIYDKNTRKDYRWNGSDWKTANGTFTVQTVTFTTSGTFVKANYPDMLRIKVTIVAEGGGSVTGDPSSFGSFLSATAGKLSTGAGTTGGVGSGGDFNGQGQPSNGGTTIQPTSGAGYGLYGNAKLGADASAGGHSWEWIEEADLGANTTVTLGKKTGAANNALCVIEIYNEA